jgi:hypothetical protein
MNDTRRSIRSRPNDAGSEASISNSCHVTIA